MPGAAHRVHLREPARGAPRDRPPLQLDLGAAAPRCVRSRQTRHHRNRGRGGEAVPETRIVATGDRNPLRVHAGVLHRDRDRLLARDLLGGHGRGRADARGADHPQPARDRRDVHAERLRRHRRVLRTRDPAPRRRRPVDPPAQRPRHGGRLRRARRHGRRRARRGLPVRQRRADRQRRPRDAGDEPVRAGRRPGPRHLGHRRAAPHHRVLQPPAGSPPPPLRGRPGLHVVLGFAPGRDQEGDGRPRRRLRRLGGPVPADRPAPRRAELRGGDPGELAVRKGRCRLHHGDRSTRWSCRAGSRSSSPGR